MLFYRAKPIFAKSKYELYNEIACPICGNTPLTQDRWMAFRYSPMALFRGVMLSFAISILAGLLLYKAVFVQHFLSQFSYITQHRIMILVLATISTLLAFAIIHWEIKMGHFSEDDKYAFGIHCKRCGNGFVGLVEAFPQTIEISISPPDSYPLLEEEKTTNE